MPKAATKQLVRFRVDFTPLCSVGPGKIDLLEAIERSGSLRQAARALHMSYPHGWWLVKDLNRSFAEAVTTATVGGGNGGGVRLTSFGARLVRCYRAAEREIESAVQSELQPITQKALSHMSKKTAVTRKRLSRGMKLLRGG